MTYEERVEQFIKQAMSYMNCPCGECRKAIKGFLRDSFPPIDDGWKEKLTEDLFETFGCWSRISNAIEKHAPSFTDDKKG